jgi:hypothetical protein
MRSIKKFEYLLISYINSGSQITKKSIYEMEKDMDIMIIFV